MSIKINKKMTYPVANPAGHPALLPAADNLQNHEQEDEHGVVGEAVDFALHGGRRSPHDLNH